MGTADAALFRPRQTNCKPTPLLRPGLLRRKPRHSQNGLCLSRTIFVAVLCMDRLARAEIYAQINSWQPYSLLLAAHKVHLHAGFRRIPYRPVSKSLKIEVGIEFAVQPHQQVTVSVGSCLDRRLLQMGHGLVITYVMVLFRGSTIRWREQVTSFV